MVFENDEKSKTLLVQELILFLVCVIFFITFLIRIYLNILCYSSTLPIGTVCQSTELCALKATSGTQHSFSLQD